MVWGRKYQITPASLEELREAGLDEVVLTALRSRGGEKPLARRPFEDWLERLGPRKIGEPERRVIRKTAQLSLLRLEKLIPSRGVREWVDALVFAVVIATVVRTFLIAPFKIPSGSMYPTIEIGDHIFATMFDYGIPVPFTDVKLGRREIARGDIVIFPFPSDPDIDYIKRVIGRGGETVALKGDQVYIDDKPLNEPYAWFDPQVVNARKLNGQSPPDFGPIRVPPGKLFMMGDNRYNSSDSRFWGFVEEQTVKGRGWIIYFSHDPNQGWFSGYRVGRIASQLE